MTGYATESASSLEIIVAWVAPKTVVPAVASTPGWYVLGEYWLPKSTTARLEAIASVSDALLTCRVRLWDTVQREAVPGEVTVTSTATARKLGALVSLTGQRRYQVQAECTGGTGTTRFATIETATISDD